MSTIVVAPDSFKGSIGAADAAAALSEGWVAVRPDDLVLLRPMADGGEGTLDAFATAVAGSERIPVRVTGPAGSLVEACWLLLPDGTGVVELASTSGIELLGDARRPWDAGTLGFGQAIAAALDFGVFRLVLGIGSSASTDGGAGLLQALGARIQDRFGRSIGPGLRGVRSVSDVDLSGLRALPDGGVTVLTDVSSPLLGPRGAAAAFGPQKGLPADDVSDADAALARFSGLVGLDPDAPGSGAAGGAGYGLRAWGARLTAGADEVASLINLPEDIRHASVVITGEGSFDGQSAAGKAPECVRALAAAAGSTAYLVAGRVAADADVSGFAGVQSLVQFAGSVDEAIASPARYLRAAGAALAAEWDAVDSGR